MPLCFWACVLAMAFCQTFLDSLAPCDAIYNLTTVIKAIVSNALRMTLENSMYMCTYIPFLIRWNLVPPYPNTLEDKGLLNDKGEAKNEDDRNDSKKKDEEVELNCDKDEDKERKQVPKNAFEEELKKN